MHYAATMRYVGGGIICKWRQIHIYVYIGT